MRQKKKFQSKNFTSKAPRIRNEDRSRCTRHLLYIILCAVNVDKCTLIFVLYSIFKNRAYYNGIISSAVRVMYLFPVFIFNRSAVSFVCSIYVLNVFLTFSSAVSRKRLEVSAGQRQDGIDAMHADIQRRDCEKKKKTDFAARQYIAFL